jgi:hypothetical protein
VIRKPATLLGFHRFAALLRMRQFRARRPRRRPTCRLSVTSTSIILVEASAACCLRIRSQTCIANDRGRSGCGGFDFWALTRPSRSSAVRRCGRRTHAALRFASLGPWDTSWRNVAGASPPRSFGRRLSASGGSPLLSFGVAYRLCRNPAGSWTKVGLTRLLFSDSFGQRLVRPAWRYPTPDELPV